MWSTSQKTRLFTVFAIALMVLATLYLGLSHIPKTELDTGYVNPGSTSVRWVSDENASVSLTEDYSWRFEGFVAASKVETGSITVLQVTNSTQADLDPLSRANGSLEIAGNQLILRLEGDEKYATFRNDVNHQIIYELSEKRIAVLIDGKLAITNSANDPGIQSPSVVVNPSESNQLLLYKMEISRDREIDGPVGTILSLICAAILILGSSALAFMFARRGNLELSVSRAKFLKTVATVILGITALAAFGHWLEILSTQQFAPVQARFSDLMQVQILGQGEPYSFLHANYPPFPMALMGLTWGISVHAVQAIILGMSFGVVLGVLLAICRVGDRIVDLWPGLAIAICFPMLFSLDRGNLDTLAIALTLLSLTALLRNRIVTGAVLASFAIALKIFPAIILLPMLRRAGGRIYFGLAVSAALVLTIMAAPIIHIPYTSSILHLVNSGDTSSLPLMQRQSWGYSLNALLLTISDYLLSGGEMTLRLDDFLNSAVMRFMELGILLISLAISLVCNLPMWKRLLIPSTAILAFTPVSFEYKGLLILIPVSIFALEPISGRWSMIYAVLIGVSLAPTGVIGFADSTVTSSTLVNGVVVLVMWSLLMVEACVSKWGKNLNSEIVIAAQVVPSRVVGK